MSISHPSRVFRPSYTGTIYCLYGDPVKLWCRRARYDPSKRDSAACHARTGAGYTASALGVRR